MGKRASRGRGSKKSTKVNDEPDPEADLPTADDLTEGQGGTQIAKVLRSQIVWIRNKAGEIVKSKQGGRQLRNWELDVAFPFAEKWDDPPRDDDGVAFKLLKYFVTNKRESDYGEAQTNLKAEGWTFEKGVGELAGEYLEFAPFDTEIDGSPREYEGRDGETKTWLQYIPIRYIPPDEYGANGIES